MNNPQNLIPFNQSSRSKEEVREINRRGGLSRSPKKSIAAKIRCLREKGLTDEYSAYLHQSIVDGEFDVVDLKHYLNRWIDNSSERDRKEILRLWLEWHKVHHGSKEKVSGDVNVQVNVFERLQKWYDDVGEKKESVVEV